MMKQFYYDNGYFKLEHVIDERQINMLVDKIDGLTETAPSGVVKENDGVTVRSLYGVHAYDEGYLKLVKHRELVDTAAKLLDKNIYIYQTKINLKKTKEGRSWPWHQDFPFWKYEDEVPHNNMLTAAILLDDVTLDNGPLMMIPGSHKYYIEYDSPGNTVMEDYVSEKLAYTIDENIVDELLKKHGKYTFCGKKGSILFFDGKIVHGSADNTSLSSRRILYITYNDINNKPLSNKRPNYLCARNFEIVN
jgi:ectoine hydroxylase